MEMKGIAVAGSIPADVINMVSKYPKEGELTQICKVSRAVGGCVPNVAIDLKRLCPDLDVMAAGRISNDDNGKYVLDILCKNGVNTDNITITDDNKTVGLSMMCYRLREANKTCLGERQERGRMGKLL